MSCLFKSTFFVLLLASTACGPDVEFPGVDPDAQDSRGTTEDCKRLVDSSYTTRADQPGGQRCGFDSRGDYSCSDTFGSWVVQFGKTGQVYWSTGETSSSGPYTCNNGTLRANLANRPASKNPVEGNIEGNVLTWDDVVYVRN